jgi:hypothetical protein
MKLFMLNQQPRPKGRTKSQAGYVASPEELHSGFNTNNKRPEAPSHSEFLGIKPLSTNKYVFCLFLFFGLLINVSAQTQQSLNGVWQSISTGYIEQLGYYELKTILTIQNNNYIWLEERVSEYAMFWSAGERGLLTINEKEIIFMEEERTFRQWELRWAEEQGTSVYKYIINNNILTLIQENNELIFTKKIE